MVAFIEIITLLLGLSGFGLQSNPAAPTPDQSLQYALPDADLVVHFDVTSVAHNYKLFVALPNNPHIKSSPELLAAVKKAVTEVEGARGIAKATMGFDPSTDVTDATAFVQYVPNKEPNAIIAVRGKFPATLIDKVGGMMKKPTTKVGNTTMLELGGNEPALGLTSTGVLLVGTPGLVRARLDAAWKPPARAAATTLGHAQDAITGKPVLAVVVNLSQTARKDISTKLGPKKNLLSEVVSRHKLFAFSVFRDGIGWTWIDRDKAGLDQMAMMSEGGIELLRASHLVPRGMSKILLGGLESYRGSDKRVDEILRRKADIMKIVESYTGDGNFKVQVDKDPKTLRLGVRATAKTVSEVVPAGFLPLGAVMAWLTLDSKSAASAPVMVAPPASKQPVPTPPKRP